MFYLRRLSFINKLKINVRSLLGLRLKEIIRIVTETIKRKKTARFTLRSLKLLFAIMRVSVFIKIGLINRNF